MDAESCVGAKTALELDRGAGPTAIRKMASVGLGIFVVFELVFLPTSNILKLVPLHKPVQRGEVYDDVQVRRPPDSAAGFWPLELAGTVCDRWAEFTGQTQGWSLFAPHFGRVASLPVVDLTWREPARTVRLLGYFTPADSTHVPWRPPEPRTRLYNFEYRLAVAGWSWDPRPLEEQKTDLTNLVVAQVGRQYRSMHAYLRWRVESYRKQNVGATMPDTAELRAVQIYPPDAVTGRRPPGREMRIAVWETGAVPPLGAAPVKVFDPKTGEPTWLTVEEGT